MNTLKQLVILFFVSAAFLGLPDCNRSYASQEGIDFFIEACRHYGGNPKLIKSLYVEAEEITETAELTPKQFEEQKADMIKEHQQRYADDPVRLKEMLDEIPDIIKAFNRGRKIQKRLLLRVDTTIHHLTKSSTRVWEEDTNAWGQWVTIVQHRGDKQKREKYISIRSEHDGSSVDINNVAWSVDPFESFGRVYGVSAFFAVVNLTQGRTDYSTHEFTPENIKNYKEQIRSTENEYNAQSFVIKGSAKYDGDKKATVLESYVQGKLVERYWIDSSRGYICPLWQVFNPETGEVINEQKAEDYFLHEESGLWYPQIYTKTGVDPSGKRPTEKTKYIIDKTTFRINFPVTDKEFSIDVPERASVDDRRNDTRASYVAIKPGTLTLAKGGLDLDKMDWLHAGNEIPPQLLQRLLQEQMDAHAEHDRFQKEMQCRGEQLNEELQRKGMLEQQRIHERMQKQMEEQQRRR